MVGSHDVRPLVLMVLLALALFARVRAGRW